MKSLMFDSNNGKLFGTRLSCSDIQNCLSTIDIHLKHGNLEDACKTLFDISFYIIHNSSEKDGCNKFRIKFIDSLINRYDKLMILTQYKNLSTDDYV